MKVRLVTQVEPELRDTIGQMADEESRSESAMANELLKEAVAIRQAKVEHKGTIGKRGRA